MRRRGSLAASIVVACVACDHPIAAVPTLATATKDLVVCWRNPDAGDSATPPAKGDPFGKSTREKPF
jgi:hypothetical protein